MPRICLTLVLALVGSVVPGPAVVPADDTPTRPRLHDGLHFHAPPKPLPAGAATSDWTAFLGPTHDGGYHLVGLRETNHRIFQSIPWSTDEVFEVTQAKIEDLGLSLCVMKKLHDMDHPEDLEHLPPDFLAEHPELAPTREPSPDTPKV